MGLRGSLRDSFFRGFSIGFLAGAAKDFLSFILFILRLQRKEYFTFFAGVNVLGRPPKNVPDYLYSVALESIFASFLGFVYVCISAKIKTRHTVLLGAVYGSMVFFAIRGVTHIFQVKYLNMQFPVFESALIWGLSVFYGLLVALLDHWLLHKSGLIQKL